MPTTFSSPNVFIEEVASTVQTTQGVSPSTAAFVGFTTQGPVNTPTLVTSFDEYVSEFGTFSTDSYMTHNVAAFFSNGGQRAYINRVIPSDAVSATASIQSKTTSQLLDTGDGASTTYTATAGASVLKDNGGASHIVPGSLSIKYRATGTPVVGQDLRNRADSADVAQVNGTANYEARVNPASITTYDPELDALVRGTCTLRWNPDGGGNRTIAIPAGSSSVVTTTANGQGSIVTLDHRSGFLSIAFAGTDIPDASAVGDINLSFTPTTATITLSSDTSVDSSGRMSITGSTLNTGGGISTNNVNVADGSYTLTFTAGSTNIPSDEGRILVTYKISAWEITPISGGEWGNNLRIQTKGSIEFFDAETASFSRHNVFVLLKDENDIYQLKETFEDLDFTDSTSALYFPDVVNELSEFINITIPGADEAPGELYGIPYTEVIAGGNEGSSNRTISATLTNTVIANRTVSITYTNTSSATKTITDDGNGNLIGDVDGSYATTVNDLGPNQINYETGEVNFRTTDAINGTSLVTVSYYVEAEEEIHTEDLGDTTKDYTYTISSVDYSFYTLGSNGTFTSVTYGQDQISSTDLEASFEGIYALNKVEEMLQVCVPDFAGDTAITIDLLNYADGRAEGPQGADRFIILTVPIDSTAQEAVDWFRFELVQSSNFAALYWPWIRVKDPLSNNRPLTVPPLGHVAGVYARTDANKNVGKGPGGTVDGKLTYLVSLETTPTLADRDLVYPNRINPFISSAVTGTAVWGVRTIAQDARWRLINARRLFMFVERSVYSLTQWTVFENNGPNLWAKVKAQLISYLTGLFNDGYFDGQKPSDAFFVICDSTNNTQESIDAGKLNIKIGLRPFKSIEFTVIQFSVLQNT